MKWMIRELMEEAGEGAPAGGEATPAPEPEAQPTAEQLEIARLKEENDRLKATPAAAPATTAQPAVTSATLEGYGPEQWQVIEERTGKTREQILRDYKDYEINQRQNALEAKNNTSEALTAAIEANPKVIKLRGAINEYLDDVPLADKLDPAKLKRHMEKAITYAKGKHMTNIPDNPAPAPRRAAADSPAPKGGDDDTPSDDVVDGEIKNDEYVSETGLRIKTGKVSKETWKQIRHKTKDPNSVCIPADFDKPPSFR